MKVYPASWVASSATDPKLLWHIAKKDKRQKVQLALGRNPNLPEDLVMHLHLAGPDVVLQDTDFHSLHTPLEEVLERSPERLSPLERERIFREATDEQLVQWWNQHEKVLNSSFHPLEYLGTPRLRDLLRILPAIDCPNRRLNTIMAACVHSPVDWSLSTWEQLLSFVPTDEEYAYAVGRTARPNPAVQHSTVEWVRFILQRTSSTPLRLFAVNHTGPEAVYDPDVRANATSLELSRMAAAGVPQIYSDTAVRLVTQKIQETQGIEAAVEMATNLDQRLPDDVKEPVYRLALLVEQDSSVFVAVQPRFYRKVIEHAIKRSSQGEHAFPDELRRALVNSTSNRCAEYLAQSTLFEEYPNHPFLHSLLPVISGDLSAYGHFGPAKMVVNEFDLRMPDAAASTWNTFLDMADGWEGSVTELLDTIEATL